MAFARFFEKAAVSAASLLQNFDFEEFHRHLTEHVPCLAFDRNGAVQVEGRNALFLTAELLARLYPAVAIVALDDDPETAATRLELVACCSKINPVIEVRDQPGETDAAIVVGQSMFPAKRAIYIGSAGWICLASLTRPVGSGSSSNPFAAGTAACLGTAILFRYYFRDQLPAPEDRDTFRLSQTNDDVLRLSVSELRPVTEPESRSLETPTNVNVGETFLVGVGAVGNGALWALSKVPHLSGDLHLIDPECIEVSNLQRYVLTDDESVGKAKVMVGADQFRLSAIETGTPDLRIHSHESDWRDFVFRRRNFHFDRVLLAVDNAADRILVQGALPRWIANAWTQPENLGVSRHHFLGPQACVACLYKPVGGSKSEDVLYAEALGASDPRDLMEIRFLLHSGRAVGEEFLAKVAARLGVPLEPLLVYATLPLRHFYSHGLCGGVVLKLGGKIGVTRQMEAPMAFQSALAGIMLAAELVLEATNARDKVMPCRSEIDLLRPIGAHISSPEGKHISGQCICQDRVYIGAYLKKYATALEKQNPLAA